jgi:hypothetical protein
MKGKLSSIWLKGFLVCLKELFIIEQLCLEVLKGDSSITISTAEGGDKCVIRGIQTTNHIGNQIFIFNSFANGSKLISQILDSKEIIGAIFLALLNGLKLAPEVGDTGLRCGSEPFENVCPNLLCC